MAADEHRGSGQGFDQASRDSQDARTTVRETVEQERSSIPRSDTQLIQASDPTPADLSPPICPRSVEAASFHTAFSSGSKEVVEDDRETGVERLGTTTDLARVHKRKTSVTPNLSIDTKSAREKPQNKDQGGRASSLSPEVPTVSVPLSAGNSPLRSSLSPRARERGLSLRRSLLARNVHGSPAGSGSVIELQSANSTSLQPMSARPSGDAGKSPEATINIAPAIQQTNNSDEGSRSTKEAHGLSSLPHYETWIANKATQTGRVARFQAVKQRLQKKILRIHEIPNSKDGRHLDLGSNPKNILIDERTGHEYIDNTILSTRYSLYNFLPRQLFAQFSKLANFYFLCVSILQMIPGLSTTGTYTTIIPLIFFVTISIAKEGYDDLRRYRLDKAENNNSASVLQFHRSCSGNSPENESRIAISGNDGSQLWARTKWLGIRVGDVVKLCRDDAVPADIVVLQANGTEGMAYVETMALDGETNLKGKQPPPLLARNCKTTSDVLSCNAHFVVEDPNLNLYNFEGKIILGDEVLPLTNKEIIYRGSIVRNTAEVIAMVIYTGEECKSRMNATKNPRIKAVSCY